MRTLEILLERRWILKSRDRELYPDEGRAGDGEEISDGEAWLSGDCEFVSGKGGENAGEAGELDGDSGIQPED